MVNRRRISFRSQVPQPANFAAAGASVATNQLTEKLIVEGVLTPRDEAIFLLQTAAEIEQALLVQYLYTAYSIDPNAAPTPEERTKAYRWQQTIARISIEEMAHLISMQNLLLFLGGPTNLEREDFPFRDLFYPFHFELEPISPESLAKYVVAEMPDIEPDAELQAIIDLATGAHGGKPINRVGALFERILELLGELSESDTYPETATTVQATPIEWISGGNRIVRTVESLDQAGLLARAIAVQGEGGDDAATSHYTKFRTIFTEFQSTTTWNPSRPMPVDPNTSDEPFDDEEMEAGRITDEESRRWAHVADLRYRLLLYCIAHSLKLDRTSLSDERQSVIGWAFLAMKRPGLVGLISHLQTLPQHDPPQNDGDGRQRKAGPPFAMPYSLNVPDNPASQWHAYLDIVDATNLLLKETTSNADLREEIERNNTNIRDQAQEYLTRASGDSPTDSPEPDPSPGDGSQAKADFVDLLKAKRGIARLLHGGVEVLGSGSLNELFEAEDYDAIITFLTTADATRPPAEGKLLIVPGNPSQSGFYIQIAEGVMVGRFTDDEVKVVERWIRSLPTVGGMSMAAAGLAPVAGASAGSLVANLVATGLNEPLFVTAPPNDNDRLFIVEKRGAIKILDLTNGEVLPTPLLQVDDLTTTGERGLLGLAFHPQFGQNGHFFVNVTDATGRTNVRRYTAQGNSADPGTRHDVILIDQPFSNHNGGWIDFGPNDDLLYIAVGDGGGANDGGAGVPVGNAQELNSLLGKILRIDVDRDDFPASPDTNYGIPASNPFVSDPSARGEIWALGLRNPWRCSFDRLTADLWIADVGQSSREEINFQSGNSRGGQNYGWRLREGTIANPAAGVGGPRPPGAVDPIHEYGRADGGTIIGGYVYRGETIAGLQGVYFYADFLSNRIWSLRYDGTSVSNHVERTANLNTNHTLLAINSFGQDGRGELYIVSMTGDIFRIEPD